MKGIRCALCGDPVSARLTREHNDANVLAMGAAIIGERVALNIVDIFLDTPFSGEEKHQRRINEIENCWCATSQSCLGLWAEAERHGYYGDETKIGCLSGGGSVLRCDAALRTGYGGNQAADQGGGTAEGRDGKQTGWDREEFAGLKWAAQFLTGHALHIEYRAYAGEQ